MRFLYHATSAAFLLSACAACGPNIVAGPKPLEYGHEAAADALTRKTVAFVRGDGGAFCAGVWVSDMGLLSAYHCIEDKPESHVGLRYVTKGDTLHGYPVDVRVARLIATDEAHDLALFEAIPPLPWHGVANVALDTIRQGSFVQTMGHPLGFKWSYAAGHVSAIRWVNFVAHPAIWTHTTVPVSKGCSGGGLFDEAGNLVGVAHGVYPEGQGLSFFVHAQYVDAFVRRHRPNNR